MEKRPDLHFKTTDLYSTVSLPGFRFATKEPAPPSEEVVPFEDFVNPGFCSRYTALVHGSLNNNGGARRTPVAILKPTDTAARGKSRSSEHRSRTSRLGKKRTERGQEQRMRMGDRG